MSQSMTYDTSYVLFGFLKLRFQLTLHFSGIFSFKFYNLLFLCKSYITTLLKTRQINFHIFIVHFILCELLSVHQENL